MSCKTLHTPYRVLYCVVKLRSRPTTCVEYSIAAQTTDISRTSRREGSPVDPGALDVDREQRRGALDDEVLPPPRAMGIS